MSIISSYVLPHLQVLIPEIGQGKEEKMILTLDSYKDVANRIAAEEPETLLIITSHADAYEDYFHICKGEGANVTFSDYGVEGINIPMVYDTELVNEIAKVCGEVGIDAGTDGDENEQVDHGTGVPLYYIDPAMKTPYKVVRISMSGLSLLTHYSYGKCIKDAINNLGRKVTVICSGDLSHRLKADGPLGYIKDASVFDTAFTAAMESANFIGLFGFEDELTINAVECVLKCATIMAGTLDGKFVKGELLSYEDTFGVGCAAFAYTIDEPDSTEVIDGRQFDKLLIETIKERLDNDDNSTNEYVRLAKKAAEHYTFTGEMLSLDNYPYELPAHMRTKRAGVFVTFKIGKMTRACMGTLSATQENIAQEIIASTTDACHIDPRFIPVDIEELDALSYQVDILGDFEPIKALSAINVDKHGLCITHGPKTGIVLPGIDGVKDAQDQLKIAKKNSGIEDGEDYNMYRFNVKRYV